MQYDRTLLVADNRRCEPKKFGGELCFESCVEAETDLSNRSGCEGEIPEIISLSVEMARGLGMQGLWLGGVDCAAFALDGLCIGWS